MAKLGQSLLEVLAFLRTHSQVGKALPAPRDKTIVYSGGIKRGRDVYRTWK